MKRVWAAIVAAPHRAGALVVLFLATPQFFLLPEGTSDVALSTVAAVLLVPLVVIGLRRGGGTGNRLVRSGLFYVLVALLAARTLALLWSPDQSAGRQPIALLGQFIVTLLLMYRAVREDPELLRKLQWAYWPWVAIQALLVLIFRLLPAVEESYLKSVAGLFAGHNAVSGLFGDRGNNVLDPAKAGGFFINANVAGLFLGVSGMAALAIYFRTRQRRVLAIGVVALVSVLFTGSKSGAVLVVALPLTVLGWHYVQTSMSRTGRRYLLGGSGALLVALIVVVGFADIDFVEALSNAFAQRTVIWGFGGQSFLDKPLTGLGYDGWETGFAPYAAAHGIYRNDFPPHNILLAAWASTGLLGLALTIAFFVLEIRLVVRRLRTRVASVDQRVVACIGAAIAWLLIQSMGENTDIFGEIHIIPILALLICYLIHPHGEELTESATQSNGGHSETPVVPAVGDVHRESGVGPAQFPAAVRREGRTAEYRGGQYG